MNMIDMNHSPARDYAIVKKALAFITENWREQPSLETIAEEAGLSPHHMQRVFTRWAGLSPKAFLQAVTLDHARGLLRDQPRSSMPPMSSGCRGRDASMISSSLTKACRPVSTRRGAGG